MIREEYVTVNTPVESTKRISWGAIFAGAIVTLLSQIMLSLLGAAIGAATIDANDSARAVAATTGIWWLISTMLSVFLGAWVAGRLSGVPRRTEGALHGIVCWGLVILASLVLSGMAAGRLVNGALGNIGGRLSNVGPAVTARSNFEEGRTRTTSPTRVRTDRADAGELDDRAERAADRAGDRVSDAVSSAAMWGFLGLLLGTIASAMGGSAGAPRRTIATTAVDPVVAATRGNVTLR
jgi:hypothetical protein